MENLVAKRNDDGTFSVESYEPQTFPYVGEYENYREMDRESQFDLQNHPEGYVTRVCHNAPDEFVLFLPEGTSEYIVLE